MFAQCETILPECEICLDHIYNYIYIGLSIIILIEKQSNIITTFSGIPYICLLNLLFGSSEEKLPQSSFMGLGVGSILGLTPP